MHPPQLFRSLQSSTYAWHEKSLNIQASPYILRCIVECSFKISWACPNTCFLTLRSLFLLSHVRWAPPRAVSRPERRRAEALHSNTETDTRRSDPPVDPSRAGLPLGQEVFLFKCTPS